MSRFSCPHNSVNATLRDMCYVSMKSCFQGLSFIYLHLRPLNNLWGRYDPKTENMAGLLPVMEPLLHIELSAMPLLKDLIEVFISFSYTHEPWAVFQDFVTKEHQILMMYFITWYLGSLQCYPAYRAFNTLNFYFRLQLFTILKLYGDQEQSHILITVNYWSPVHNAFACWKEIPI